MANSNLSQTQKALLISSLLHVFVVTAFAVFFTHKETPTEKTVTLLSASFQKEDMQTKELIREQKKEEKVNKTKTHHLQKQYNDKPIQNENKNIKTESSAKDEEFKVVEKTASIPTIQKQHTEVQKDETAEYIEANLAKIREAIAKYKRYPPLAIKMGCEGVCSVSFKLTPSGNITEIKIIKSSGFAALDKSSLQTVENAASEMPRPYKIVTITIPIEYKLN
jgi:TonB family protein